MKALLNIVTVFLTLHAVILQSSELDYTDILPGCTAARLWMSVSVCLWALPASVDRA